MSATIWLYSTRIACSPQRLNYPTRIRPYSVQRASVFAPRGLMARSKGTAPVRPFATRTGHARPLTILHPLSATSARQSTTYRGNGRKIVTVCAGLMVPSGEGRRGLAGERSLPGVPRYQRRTVSTALPPIRPRLDRRSTAGSFQCSNAASACGERSALPRHSIEYQRTAADHEHWQTCHRPC